MLDPETIGKTADAAKALAETAGKGIDATRSVARVFSGVLEPVLDMFKDRAKFTRWKRLLAYSDEAAEIMKARGLEAPTRALPPAFAYPLLEKATLEEDDDLRTVWARLLVNASDASTPMELRTAYVSVLSELSAFDVQNFAKLVEASLAARPEDKLPAVETGALPSRASVHTDSPQRDPPELTEEVSISMGNLYRVGCIIPVIGWGGSSTLSLVNVTGFGRAFYRACA